MGNNPLLTEMIYQPELRDIELQTASPTLPKIANSRLLIPDKKQQNNLKNEAGDGLEKWNLQTQEKVYFSPHWKIILGYQEPEICEPNKWLHRIHPDQVKIAEALPIPVFITTAPKGRILYVNQSYAKAPSDCFLGFSAAELIGRNTADFLYNSTDKNVLQNILLKEGCLRHYELQVKRADGMLIWIDLSLQSLSSNDQNLFVACCFDITKRKQIEAELDQAQGHLKLVQPTNTEDKKDQELPTTFRPFLSNVFHFIETNYHNQISLREVAKSVGYSCAYLTNLVQQETGKSVNQWIIDYRMKEARLLLLETNQLVKNIAIEVGYQGTEHFIRQFRQFHGMTPQNWRNKHRS